MKKIVVCPLPALFSRFVSTRLKFQPAILVCALATWFMADTASGQIAIGAGTYALNFDVLASSGTVAWTNNVTLPGWYAAKGSTDVTNYTVPLLASTSKFSA